VTGKSGIQFTPNWREIAKAVALVVGVLGGGTGLYSVQSAPVNNAECALTSQRLDLHEATDSVNRINTLEKISDIQDDVQSISIEQKKQGDMILVIYTKLNK